MKCIGNYQLGKTIGSGTFGKVKLAIHLPTQQQVAIKIMKKERMADIIDIERVQRELHILRTVRHPNIVMLYEVFETRQHIFLVMEYCPKELFSHIVKSKRLSEMSACALFQQLLSGVEYLHKLKIVHRDIKPENLLLKNRLKIVDFGLSNTYQDLLKTACGSPCYAAPEMISGKLYNGLKADLWSCGVVLFVMLCGYLPFEDQNTNQLYKKILAANYKLPSFLSTDAADLIRLILNPDPLTRPNIDLVRKHPWFNLYKCTYQLKQGIFIGSHKIPIDQNIVQQVEKLGYKQKYICQCLLANVQNDATTAYYLLLDQLLQSGQKSIADIASDGFQAQLIEQQMQTIDSELHLNFTRDSEQSMKKIMETTPKTNSNINKTERYPLFEKFMQRGLTIGSRQNRSESEQRPQIQSKSSIEGSSRNKSISLSDYYSEKYNKDLPLPVIPQQLKRKRLKLKQNLIHIQNAYGLGLTKKQS